MKRRYISAMLLAFGVGFLAGCASPGPVSRQNRQISSQPDTGKTVDYLHFAGLSYGDTLDDLVRLFGEPTSVGIGDEEDTSNNVFYKIDGKECLHVIYDKPTRRVEFIRAKCGQIRDLLLSKQLDDPKLTLLARHKDSILERYGSPDETASDHYGYDFQDEGGSEGQVTFACYDFDGSRCTERWVQWFFPLTEAETTEFLKSVQSDMEKLSEEKQKKIRHLLELTKVADQGKQIFDSLLSSTRPRGMSDDAWAEVVKEFNFQELIELMVPVYANHLTEEEIDDLIAFYSTPTGRSFVDKQPELFKGILSVSQEWGKKVAQRMHQRLEVRKKKTIGP
jgi:hypothetical protein